jgi:hypothetical protein
MLMGWPPALVPFDVSVRTLTSFESTRLVVKSTLPFVNVFSELYEPLDAERRLEIRQWWHGKIRGEANQFDDLRMRLSRLT